MTTAQVRAEQATKHLRYWAHEIYSAADLQVDDCPERMREIAAGMQADAESIERALAAVRKAREG